MKKLMVLAAGLLQIPVIKKAREMGVYVIAVDDDPNAPGMAMADKAIVPGGLMNEEKLVAIAKEEQINGVIHPCSEVAMNVMGRINDELHLHGISRDTAIRATNKHLMREAFEAYGAPSPRSYCSTDVKEGWRLFKSIGGKAILKPSRNSGSRGIAEIEPDIQLEQFTKLFERSKAESRDASVMIEQFVEGPEFSVEIIVWDNIVNVLQVTDKKTTEAPYFVELGHSQPSQFPEDVVNSIKDAAVQGVKALQLNNCAAHAEVKYQGGKPYIMEIGARLGGDFISTELTHLSTGIDMVAAAIDVALGNEPSLKPVEEGRGVCIRYFTPEPGEVEYVREGELKKQNNVYNAEIYVKPGDMVNEVKSSLDRSGHVIITADNVQAAVEKADKIVGGGILSQNQESSNQLGKKIMVLGASYLQSFIITKIKEMGHQAIALDGNPNCDSKDLADRFYACNTTDKEAVLEIAKKENIDGIMTYASDVAAPVVSFVAEHLNLPTNPFESVDIMTDKEKTRSFMEANGFNVPSHSQVTCVEEALQAAERIGYPVFIKPVDSNGSKGASRVNSIEEVRKSFEYAVNNSRSSRVIVEKFIVRKGYQVDADCFMYDGKLEFFYPMDQHQDPIAPYSPIGISAPSVLDEKKAQVAKDEVQRFLSLLNMKFGEFNVEYVFDENDDFYIIEIGPRSGGNLIPDVILESAGIDLRELNIRATLGEDISDFPFEKYTFKLNVTSHIFHSQTDGLYEGIEFDDSIKDSVIFSKLFVKPGDIVHKFTSGVYALGFCLLKFDDNRLMNLIMDNSSKYIKVLVK